jgi:hypothetical protein
LSWQHDFYHVWNGIIGVLFSGAGNGFQSAAAIKERSRTMEQIRNVFIGLMLVAVSWSLNPGSAGAEEDSRELVKLPEMMQQHMLGNMRDHLSALDDMLGALAEGNTDKAAEIAESRLGMSSLTMHGAAQLGKFMPKAMGEMSTTRSLQGLAGNNRKLQRLPPGLSSAVNYMGQYVHLEKFD